MPDRVTASALGPIGEWPVYWLDATQRALLFLDIMHHRSERNAANVAKVAPHVLKFEFELIMDGRTLQRPVNYVLVRVKPPKGTKINPHKRPFVIVDPRAGHGPGIGGFKPDSEIGAVFQAGHPCYFIGFLPEPMPEQTIEDIACAEAQFLERVNSLHSEADGKPAVVGNCQAGWAVMMLAAVRPELFGPIIVAGSPLSYWAGGRGQNPMRYNGGLLGGSWLTALMGDLGNGKFDGAWLVSNFENLNLANTYWTKSYDLYAKIDTEASRYLAFQDWWGAPVLLNSEEIQYIVDQLFIGNKLASGEMVTSHGTRIDLRNIRSPIVAFCSKGDNITPPPQALDWILDLYENVADIRAYGQTIVYAVHESIGHLGIFVSGRVAKKEHDQFASNIDLIDTLPPGLYEAVITPKPPGDSTSGLIQGEHLVRFEARTLDDIRALGCNDEDDERAFATVAKVSDINLGLYRTFVQPWMRLWSNEAVAESMRRIHPLRSQYEVFSDANPFMRPFVATVSSMFGPRQGVSADNPFWRAQEWYAEWVRTSFDAYQDVRDKQIEAIFFAVYGSPLLQALVGLRASDASARPRPGRIVEHDAIIVSKIEELRGRIAQGGPREAAIRALLYIFMPANVVDERGFNLLRRMRSEAGEGLSLAEFKTISREQFCMLLIDERRAIEAIPDMLEADLEQAAKMERALQVFVEEIGVIGAASKARVAEIDQIFQSLDRPSSPRRAVVR